MTCKLNPSLSTQNLLYLTVKKYKLVPILRHFAMDSELWHETEVSAYAVVPADLTPNIHRTEDVKTGRRTVEKTTY